MNRLCQGEDATELEAPAGAPATPNPPTVPYTVFSRSTIRLLTVLVGMASVFSSLSANIYFPSISVLSRSLHTSIQKINLTITSYIVVQAISPALLGGLADNFGRRPIYLISFSVYVLANLGLALQNAYPALLVLRMLQSFGCSAAIAIGFGVASDVAVPAERGRMLGPASIAMNLGTCLGPLLGGLLAKNAGWRWIFWALLIVGASFLLILTALLPETARSVVGNGEIEAPCWNQPLLPRANFKPEQSTRHSLNSLNHSSEGLKTRDLWIDANPFKSLRLLLHQDTGLVVWSSAIVYAAYYVIQASMPQILEKKYGFNEQQVGLSYLAMGGGVVIGGYANGTVFLSLLRHSIASYVRSGPVSKDKFLDPGASSLWKSCRRSFSSSNRLSFLFSTPWKRGKC
jgi:multidrug resistance protein